MEKKENFILPNRKNTSPIPINNFLSLKQLIPFENHPSARGLKKNEQTEKLPQSISISLEKNDDKENKQTSNFQILLEPIDEIIYQNEVYFQKMIILKIKIIILKIIIKNLILQKKKMNLIKILLIQLLKKKKTKLLLINFKIL